MVVFALAWLIAAESESGEITLARDPIGVQPLYYTVLPTGGLLYSDRIADMLADSRVSDELDQHAIALRILSQADLSRTEYLAIRPVPPGHVVTWTPDSVPVVQRYRDPTLLPPPDESMSFDDCVPATREALWSSTARALGDSTSVAAHISGGLDSTSIAVVANRILRKDGHRLLAGYSWSLSLNTGIARGESIVLAVFGRCGRRCSVLGTSNNGSPRGRRWEAVGGYATDFPCSMRKLSKPPCPCPARRLDSVLLNWRSYRTSAVRSGSLDTVLVPRKGA